MNDAQCSESSYYTAAAKIVLEFIGPVIAAAGNCRRLAEKSPLGKMRIISGIALRGSSHKRYTQTLHNSGRQSRPHSA